ncbi:E3 SUMO-protein ligase KIAA1586-like [Dendronephthya gigantea]|uniref:E3 SUMO-protein ligase KIAA1586-like n=1 Tax=Dendronephthya gigantea TaxID=151771 RepID=UPI00106BCB9E|nr:E3 SUMO-protein ligase KIAA1586-like [Dendronephthya gigantea]
MAKDKSAEVLVAENEKVPEQAEPQPENAGEHSERVETNEIDEAAGPSTAADVIDKPTIWTDKMWHEKQQLYPWLQCKNGKLGCSFCISAKDLGPHRTQGRYLSTEWQATSVTYYGNSQEARLTSLRKKIYKHLNSDAHKQAEEMVNQKKKNIMPVHIDVMNTEWLDTTKRVFRTSYYIAKNDRPLNNIEELVDLQIHNGLDMGTGLHSRSSATAIIDHIAYEMRSTICKTIKENKGKVSILIDESTTVSGISTLIIYLKAQLERSGEAQFLFLDLVELTNGQSAKEVHTALLACLKRHGFDMDYLQEHFVAFTTDGASVLTGKKSGVMELLMNDFPNLITWHCLNHRLELAVEDAISELTGINHFKIFVERLYSIYSQSPKNVRELREVAKSLDVQLLKIGKVLSTRWVASSHRTVLAVWNNYEALCKHFKDKAAEKGKNSTMYEGLNKRIQSEEFLLDLALMCDVLFELSELSEAMQHRSMNIVKADRCIKRSMRSIETLKRKTGTKLMIAKDAVKEGKFGTVPLVSNRRHVNIDANALIDKLLDAMKDRLFATCASGTVRESAAYQKLLDQICVLYPTSWPQDLDLNYGEEEVRSLCDRFSLSRSSTVPAFQDYVDSQGRRVPDDLQPLLRCCSCILVSSAECELGFSQMNLVCTSVRNRLLVERISNLMFIKLVGPPINAWNPEKYTKSWLRKHHSANDERVRKRKLEEDAESQQEQTAAKQRLWQLL